MECRRRAYTREFKAILPRVMTLVLWVVCLGSASMALAAGSGGQGAKAEPGKKQDSAELYPFFRGGRIGLIDATGKEVVPPEYEKIGKNQGLPPYATSSDQISGILRFLRESFSDYPVTAKVFPFSRDGKWGFMDDRGQVVIKGPFDEAKFFGESVPLAPVKTAAGWGFIDRKGKYAIQPVFQNTVGFQGKLAPVMEYGRWGLIKPNGKYACLPVLDGYPQPFPGAELMVQNEGGKWGFLDAEGKFAIPPKFAAAGPFREGRGSVMVEKKWGFVDRGGNLVIEPRFAAAGPFFNGLAMVRSPETKKCGYIDRDGNVVIPTTYDWCNPFMDVLAPVKSGRNWGYLDKSGNLAVGFQYEGANEFGEDGLALLFKKGRYGYIDREGKYLLSQWYVQAKEFSKGLAAVSVGPGRWGYLDTTGTFVIEPQFLEAYPFNGRLALVEMEGAVGYVDRTGKVVHRTTYDEMAAH